MDVEVQGKTVELDDRVRDQITKKLDRLGRHVPGVAAATVELSMENTKGKDQRVVVQVTLDINGTDLRSEEKGANTMAAVNAVTDVLDRRVERYKSRSYRSAQAKKPGKNVSIRTIDAPNDLAEVVPVSEGTIESQRVVVRVKRFPIKPMTVDDTVFQMELLGHDFFMFLDSETVQHNLLYKRRDGDYGLIQPEPL